MDRCNSSTSNDTAAAAAAAGHPSACLPFYNIYLADMGWTWHSPAGQSTAHAWVHEGGLIKRYHESWYPRVWLHRHALPSEVGTAWLALQRGHLVAGPPQEVVAAAGCVEEGPSGPNPVHHPGGVAVVEPQVVGESEPVCIRVHSTALSVSGSPGVIPTSLQGDSASS